MADEEETSEVDDGREWYVVHSYSGMETKVKKNLEHRIESMGMSDRIFNVIVPTEEQIELKDGERRVVERRVFPGYILIEMVLYDESWYVVRNTPGVTGFVGIGNRPTPLSPDEVDRIMSRIEADEPSIKVDFKVGERVRVTEGAFAEFHGVVDDIDLYRGKARVMISIFGRETPVEVDFLQLERS
ncbi:MAG: transcription termination/antitermination protein NusG [Chloroflexi bacterium]|nr:transcription termination/antitermination protein NusG [Chloroflexota bacterium]